MSDLEELKRLHAEFMGGTSAVGDYDEAHAALCSALIRSFPAIVARLEAAQRLRDAVQGYLNVPTDTMAVDLEDALAAFDKEQQ